MSTLNALGKALFLLASSSAVLGAQQSLGRHDWQVFRNAYPYHIQVIAEGGQYSSGGRTLIISEPPPDINLGQILEVDPLVLV